MGDVIKFEGYSKECRPRPGELREPSAEMKVIQLADTVRRFIGEIRLIPMKIRVIGVEMKADRKKGKGRRLGGGWQSGRIDRDGRV